MRKFVELRAKTYSYLTDDRSEDKTGKVTKENFILKIIQLNLEKEQAI